MRKYIIAGNWKMNKTIAEAREFIDNLKLKDGVEVVLFPPYTALSAFVGNKVQYGGQNMHYEESGTYTGEISILMLKELDCNYVLLGHSDRRHKFNEDNEIINKKIKTAIKYKMKVMLCVGETADEREAGNTEKVIEEQLAGLEGVNSDSIVIAYEPVWAISPGVITKDQKVATPEEAEKAHSFIRSVLAKQYNEKAEEIRILYGGSSSPDNVEMLLSKPNIDGCLAGAKSLTIDTFNSMIEKS